MKRQKIPKGAAFRGKKFFSTRKQWGQWVQARRGVMEDTVRKVGLSQRPRSQRPLVQLFGHLR